MQCAALPLSLILKMYVLSSGLDGDGVNNHSRSRFLALVELRGEFVRKNVALTSALSNQKSQAARDS